MIILWECQERVEHLDVEGCGKGAGGVEGGGAGSQFGGKPTGVVLCICSLLRVEVKFRF